MSRSRAVTALIAAIGPLDGSGYATRIDSMVGAYTAAGWHVDLVHVRTPIQAPAHSALAGKLRRYIDIALSTEHRDHLSVVPPLARFVTRAWTDQRVSLDSYDIAQSESSAVWAIATEARARRRILVLHDDDSVRYKRMARQMVGLPRKAARLTSAWKYGVYQQRIARQADSVWFVSEDERARFRDVRRDAELVPNGAGREFFEVSDDADNATVAFVGPAEYDANRRAVEHLIAHSWSGIRARVPTAELRLVGRGWEEHRDPRAGIVATGWVDDLPSVIGRAAVAVAPHLDGGGTKLKVIEAMAAARPVVATVVGAEGIPASPGVVVVDDPQAFGVAVVELLGDEERRRQLGRSNRAAVEHLEWSRIWAPVVAKLQADADAS